MSNIDFKYLCENAKIKIMMTTVQVIKNNNCMKKLFAYFSIEFLLFYLFPEAKLLSSGECGDL
jgi:hypothetical protein